MNIVSDHFLSDSAVTRLRSWYGGDKFSAIGLHNFLSPDAANDLTSCLVGFAAWVPTHTRLLGDDVRDVDEEEWSITPPSERWSSQDIADLSSVVEENARRGNDVERLKTY